MTILDQRIWYIDFNIKKYNKIDDILDIIRLIDENICFEEKIFNQNVLIKINRSKNTLHDYKCETNIPYDKKNIETYLNYKFKQIENKIKFSFDEFGDKWYIDYKLVNL